MNRHASMNRTYRLLWSQARGAWVPVAEITKGRRRSKRTRSASRGMSSTAALLLALAPLAHGGPTGGQVVAGTGSISQSGTTTNIRQSSQNLSINWQSFNIAPQETVDFLQPSATAIAVNRIGGSNGSEILGRLEANGQVFLINPNGILFGKSAEVNVGGLVASTLDLNDVSMIGSAKSFGGSTVGSVINQGTIAAASGGYVALMGTHVVNQGVITAQLGTVALGAGSAVTLTFNGTSLVHLRVDRSVLRSLAENGGIIRADGGQVIVTAGAKDALLASVVNNTGVIEARTVENHDGTMMLLGGMTAGTVNVGGTLDASAPEGGHGGAIETSGAHVEVAGGAKVTTAATRGLFGSWLIDPHDFTVAASGGDITGATLSTELATTPVTLQSSSGSHAGSGNVNIDDTVSWNANTRLTLTASNNVNVNANITAAGATAGLAINPNTANGPETASGTGTFNLGAGAAINLPNMSPTSSTALLISGTSYAVINSLGAPGSITGADLQGLNGNLAGHYALGSNIDATPTSTWNAATGFTPIGNLTHLFTGSFDGLGHTIGKLTINASQTGVGLFGYTGTSAVIRNVGLIGGSMHGYGYVGGLVGINAGAISHSYATSSVAATGNSGQFGYGYAGGLVGKNTGTIDHSYATGDVFGSDNVGGLVGYTYGTVSNSYAAGNVSAIIAASNLSFGALGGLAGANSGRIANSHATGSVSGASYSQSNSGSIGGLVGANSSSGTVSNTYATGGVDNAYGNVGGLVGENAGAIGHSHATGSVTASVSHIGAANGGGLVGYNVGTIGDSYATGGVTGSNFNNCFGYGYAGGLVGENTGTISNSYATGSVSGSSYTGGGLVGLNGGNISNSYATGSVIGSGNYGGGLVGQNGGNISNSYATGSVVAFATAGGLVGHNSATVSHSFWDVTTSGRSSSAGGVGMTTAQMQTQANFTSATAANGHVNPGWDFTHTWVMYNGHTYPLLTAFMTPLTVTANGATKTYNGAAFSGGNGVSYSVAPSGNLFGTVKYGGTSQGAVNVGRYLIMPGGLYSNQQGYIIKYRSGTLTVDQLGSVAWTGGVSGNWSNRSNWAGGAIPDYANVASVTIPPGVTVTYDSGMPGSTTLSTLTSRGNLHMAAGTLSTTGNLSTGGLVQSGGTLDVGGSLTVKSTSGGVVLGNISAGSLSISSEAGSITQLASSAVNVKGATTLTADNGVSGAGDRKYNITLANAADKFVGEVAANGSAITLDDTAALTAFVNSPGAVSLTAAGALDVSGTIGTNLTTVTTGGTGSTTTFGTTTVGNNLKVTSKGAVKKAMSTTALKVHGAGTSTPNSHVTVNGVVGALIK